MNQSPELLRRLLRAKDRMDHASHEDWPVARLAEVSAVSAAHFARSFKQAFGLPPHRYLLSRRIERAVAMLRDTDLPVTEIAAQTGWSSLGTFGRIFRDITGDNPGRVRARERMQPPLRGAVPECHARSAQRPHLETSVLEQRRRGAPPVALAAGGQAGTAGAPRELPASAAVAFPAITLSRPETSVSSRQVANTRKR